MNRGTRALLFGRLMALAYGVDERDAQGVSLDAMKAGNEWGKPNSDVTGFDIEQYGVKILHDWAKANKTHDPGDIKKLASKYEGFTRFRPELATAVFSKYEYSPPKPVAPPAGTVAPSVPASNKAKIAFAVLGGGAVLLLGAPLLLAGVPIALAFTLKTKPYQNPFSK
jgi:hypothetical protein